jgi:hypothetical protein
VRAPGQDGEHRVDKDLTFDMWVIEPPRRQAGERAAHDLGEGLDLLVGEVRSSAASAAR